MNLPLEPDKDPRVSDFGHCRHISGIRPHRATPTTPDNHGQPPPRSPDHTAARAPADRARVCRDRVPSDRPHACLPGHTWDCLIALAPAGRTRRPVTSGGTLVGGADRHVPLGSVRDDTPGTRADGADHRRPRALRTGTRTALQRCHSAVQPPSRPARITTLSRTSPKPAGSLPHRRPVARNRPQPGGTVQQERRSSAETRGGGIWCPRPNLVDRGRRRTYPHLHGPTN